MCLKPSWLLALSKVMAGQTLVLSPLIQKLSATVCRPVFRAGRISNIVQTLNQHTGMSSLEN
jgi:hypothetical protein